MVHSWRACTSIIQFKIFCTLKFLRNTEISHKWTSNRFRILCQSLSCWRRKTIYPSVHMSVYELTNMYMYFQIEIQNIRMRSRRRETRDKRVKGEQSLINMYEWMNASTLCLNCDQKQKWNQKLKFFITKLCHKTLHGL